MVYNVFVKKTSGGATTLARSENLATRNKFAVRNKIVKEWAEVLYKPIIKKRKKEKYTWKKKSTTTIYRQIFGVVILLTCN